MTRRGSVASFLPFLVAACGGPAAPPAPPSLGYDAVTVPTAVYEFGDTARVDVDAGGRTVEAGVSTSATLDVEFRPSPEGVTVAATFREFSARATNPMAAPETASTADVEGPLVFSLDRRGVSTLVSSPQVAADAEEFLSPEARSATLFPRLPGRAVEPGESWVDTIRVEVEQAGTRLTRTSVITYTAVGDTVLDGRTLLEVSLEGTDSRALSGRRDDMEMSQDLDGSSSGWFLWDLSRGLLHESVYDADLSGTMQMAAAPFPLSLRVRARSEFRLVGVPAGS